MIGVESGFEIYKSLHALWDVKSKENSNRQKKIDAYAILLRKYQDRYPEAKKIGGNQIFNFHWTNFRKETKKSAILKKKKCRRFRRCFFLFFFAFTQKAKEMATQAASVSLIMSELQLIVAQLGCVTEPCGEAFNIIVQ